MSGPASAAELDWGMDLTVSQAATSVVDVATQHKVGMLEIAGKAQVGGEEADVTVYALIDYTNGSGPWQAYMTVTFADGSALVAYGSGMTAADEKGLNSRFQGPLMVVGGSGRYASALGSGTMVGARTSQVGDDVVIHYEITLALDD